MLLKTDVVVEGEAPSPTLPHGVPGGVSGAGPGGVPGGIPAGRGPTGGPAGCPAGDSAGWDGVPTFQATCQQIVPRGTQNAGCCIHFS